jgi:hypothetical protein
MQVSTTYSINVDDAKEVAKSLQGKIGGHAYSALLTLLNS